jgi:phosphotransferase system enzyme I (PtsI)
MAELQGVGVSPGLAGGPVRHLHRPEVTRPADEPAHGDAEDELRAARDALEAVAAELTALGERTGGEAADVLAAEAMMARDPEIADAVAGAVRDGRAATVAVYDAFGTYRDLLAGAGEYVAGRVADVVDVRDRVLARLRGSPVVELPAAAEPYVLVALDLTPADTAGLDLAQVRGFVTEQGGPTSHTAILARSLGIPAVVACAGATGIDEGTVIVADGETGEVFLDAVVAQSRGTVEFDGAETADDDGEGGRTADGRTVPLLVNLGGAAGLEAELAAAANAGAEGVGLLRTEFLFLDRVDPPERDDQVRAYQRVLAAFDRVIVRVLDAGADKPLGFLPPPAAEPNPALGLRGIRALRVRPALLDEQLEALAEAVAGLDARIGVMAPMVADAAEARWFAGRCRAAGVPGEVGAMVEVPAAALRAADIAAEVDFLSIGTNDLTQYALAADRGVAGLAGLQDPWHPAVLDLIAMTVTAAAGCRVGVCGEAAADPALACVLVGLGVDTLSMGAASIPRVRSALAANTADACAAAAQAARSASSARDAKAAAVATLGA